jgi:hypothetical protein
MYAFISVLYPKKTNESNNTMKTGEKGKKLINGPRTTGVK